ncbi:MAG: hypothetical protein VXA68_10990, partial [Gammaproteobacteria bacterium]
GDLEGGARVFFDLGCVCRVFPERPGTITAVSHVCRSHPSACPVFDVSIIGVHSWYWYFVLVLVH